LLTSKEFWNRRGFKQQRNYAQETGRNSSRSKKSPRKFWCDFWRHEMHRNKTVTFTSL